MATAERRPVFSQAVLADEVFALLAEDQETLAACLMPDHLHWLLADAGRMIRAVQRFKSEATLRARCHGFQGRIWQRSFWDHVLRREESTYLVARYVVENPVRAGLVVDVADYPYQVSHLTL